MEIPPSADDLEDVKAPRGIFLEGILEDILPTLSDELKDGKEEEGEGLSLSN